MDRGFSLVEVLVASVVLTAGLIALAQLCVVSIRVNQVARRTTVAAVLAGQKMEQLQALAMGFDSASTPFTDTATDTTFEPERSTGGTGLAPSPADAIVRETSGYFDFVDSRGRSLGGGSAPPASTTFIRRWSIEPIVSADGLLMQISVSPRGMQTGSSSTHRPEEVRLSGIKARKSN